MERLGIPENYIFTECDRLIQNFIIDLNEKQLKTAKLGFIK